LYNAAKIIAFEKARKDPKDVHAYFCPPSSVKHFLKLRHETNDYEDETLPWMKMIQLCFSLNTYLVKYMDLETREAPSAFKESPRF
jgi:hypothetical protein